MQDPGWRDRLRLAFPEALRDDASVAIGLLDEPEYGSGCLGDVVALVGGERLSIPYRIYSPEPRPSAIRNLVPVQRQITHAILTRHHGGYVRERHLQALLDDESEWVPPFVIQALGEYVLEIHEIVADALRLVLLGSHRARASYAAFVRANPDFVALTRSRVVSYWNCYYRAQFPKRRRDVSGPAFPDDYPAWVILDELCRLADADRSPGWLREARTLDA